MLQLCECFLTRAQTHVGLGKMLTAAGGRRSTRRRLTDTRQWWRRSASRKRNAVPGSTDRHFLIEARCMQLTHQVGRPRSVAALVQVPGRQEARRSMGRRGALRQSAGIDRLGNQDCRDQRAQGGANISQSVSASRALIAINLRYVGAPLYRFLDKFLNLRNYIQSVRIPRKFILR